MSIPTHDSHPVIGYTAGVFDMFHIGHLNILKRAKEQCDYLIVGVSTDELVQEYKHHQTVVPLEQRIAIVSAIRYVDKVVVQTSMDKLAAWQKLHFHKYFHGDDWKNSPLYNKIEQDLQAKGVEVVFLPHTPGVSTTILVELIKGGRR